MIIIKDEFTSGAQVSMEMDKDAGELFVFHCPAGQGCKVNKWPLDSYHMPIAMAYYTECCTIEQPEPDDIDSTFACMCDE